MGLSFGGRGGGLLGRNKDSGWVCLLKGDLESIKIW